MRCQGSWLGLIRKLICFRIELEGGQGNTLFGV